MINPVNGQKYILEQFHFHFGCQNYVGSEHTVDGVPSAGEVSVSLNRNYGNNVLNQK